MNWSDIAAAAATLFFVMDPLGNTPVFNAVLSRFTPQRRAQITARELVIALAILLLFLFAGTAVLEFLGLTQPSLSIAGGVLLFIIALRMIFPHAAGEVASEKDEPFIVPLAMPMVAGAVDDRDSVAALLHRARAHLGVVHGARDRVGRHYRAADGVPIPAACAGGPRLARARAPHGHAARAACDANAAERGTRVRAFARHVTPKRGAILLRASRRCGART